MSDFETDPITDEQYNAIMQILMSQAVPAYIIASRVMCDVGDVQEVAEENGFVECDNCGSFFNEDEFDENGNCEDCADSVEDDEYGCAGDGCDCGDYDDEEDDEEEGEDDA